MKRPIAIKEIKPIIIKLSPPETLGPGSSIGEFYQKYKEEITQLAKLSSRRWRELFVTHSMRPALP